MTASSVQLATYTYDEAARLVAESVRVAGAMRNFSYTYDPQGNRTSATGPAGTTTATYNPGGELMSTTDPASSHGRSASACLS